MANFSQNAFAAALYAKLTADSTLMALISAVYDFVPQAPSYPYVTMGAMSGRDWSTKTTGGMQYTAEIRVYSREAGRKQAASIMERVHTLLHQGTLTISGQTLVSMRFEGSELTLQNDGLTYQGALRIRALVAA